MNEAEAIIICNAALTRTGNDPITDFDDGSAEATVMAANYEEIIKEELSEHTWSFAKSDNDPNRLSEDAIDEWAYVYQLPTDLIRLVRVHVNGRPIPFKRKGAKLYCNEIENVRVEYISRPDEEEWPYDFRGKIITRLEALSLRALSEDYDKAELRENKADEKTIMSRSHDSQNQSPKDRRSVSRLVNIRRG